MADLISHIVRYLHSGSARRITSAEIAVVLFDLQDSDRIKGPQEKVRRAIRKNRTALQARGIDIESGCLGYRIKRR